MKTNKQNRLPLFLLCFILIVSLAGCGIPKTETKVPTATQPSAPFTEQTTDNGILVTTPYFTVTLPSLWKDNYKIQHSDHGTQLNYRLIDAKTSPDYGGHIFTIALYKDYINAAESCTTNGMYLGVLQGDDTYMVIIHSPTDLPVSEDRVAIYAQLQETKQEVLSSFTATKGYTFTQTGADNYRQRAALLQTPVTGKEIAQQFTKDTDIPLSYVGLCADLLVTETDGVTVAQDNATHHLYQDPQGNPYLIPLSFINKTDFTTPTVYKVEQFPHIVPVWSMNQTKFDEKWLSFLKTKEAIYEMYCLKDLDGEGIPELLVLQNTSLSVYLIEEDGVTLADQFDSITATMTYHFWYGIDRPGVFTKHVGGGQTHYGYLQFANHKLQHQIVVSKNTTNVPDTPEISKFSNDENLIEIATSDLPELQFSTIVLD
jgi:hypothetical protein